MYFVFSVLQTKNTKKLSVQVRKSQFIIEKQIWALKKKRSSKQCSGYRVFQSWPEKNTWEGIIRNLGGWKKVFK